VLFFIHLESRRVDFSVDILRSLRATIDALLGFNHKQLGIIRDSA
jgi:hypothetical protein